MLNGFDGSRVLITGGLGFIGSNLARKLLGLGAEVTIVDSLIPEYGGNLFNVHDIQSGLSINICDVRDEFALRNLLANKDYLFNLAGQTSHLGSMSDPTADLDINIGAQLSILEICKEINPGIKIVFTSTRQLYGKPSFLPVTEDHAINPVDVNGINKFAGERYHILYNNVYQVRSSILRLTNTYGPCMRVRDARQTFLGIWIRNLIEGKPLQVFGSGLQLRDFNHVDDVVDALLLTAASEQANGQVYNLGDETPISLANLAKVLSGLDVKGSYEVVDFPEARKKIDIGDYYGSIDKINSQLGWSPKVGLKEGLEQTVEYYRSNWRHYWNNTK